MYRNSMHPSVYRCICMFHFSFLLLCVFSSYLVGGGGRGGFSGEEIYRFTKVTPGNRMAHPLLLHKATIMRGKNKL